MEEAGRRRRCSHLHHHLHQLHLLQGDQVQLREAHARMGRGEGGRGVLNLLFYAKLIAHYMLVVLLCAAQLKYLELPEWRRHTQPAILVLTNWRGRNRAIRRESLLILFWDRIGRTQSRANLMARTSADQTITIILNQIFVAIQYSIWSHPYQRVDENLWCNSDIKF